VANDVTRYQRDADGYLPIAGYGAIGNGRTVALVGSDASIDWLCFPRIDSASTFGRLLDAERGGFWQIAPTTAWSARHYYVHDSNVLATRFETEDGVVEVIDFMPSLGFGASLGVVDRITAGMVVRVVRGVEGVVRVRQQLRAAFDYGRDPATFELVPGRGALVRGEREYLAVLCAEPLREEGDCLCGELEIAAGEELHIAAMHHVSAAPVWLDLAPGTIDHLLDYELRGWRAWIERCSYDGPYDLYVRRSALTLKLLDYLPTGAMVAAATTSLPEHIGGVRNWDYRYAWIRDTSYALYSLISIGYREEAEGFFQWVVDSTDMDPTTLQIMYRVTGARDLHEQQLDHLSGYRGSRPVRIGNAAFQQRQLDVWGEILDAAHCYRRLGGVISEALWRYLVAVAGQVVEHWRDPDSGIWEVRSEPRRMTYSNVMSWVALDRAIKLAETDGRTAPLALWKRTRDTIRAEIYEYGVSKDSGAFTLDFEGGELDASALSFPLRRFISANDPIMVATAAQIERTLTVDGLVARYRVADESGNVDGVSGREGHFVLTSFWAIDNLIARGELDAAQERLERLLARTNDLGLYAEQIDPGDGRFLGNFPQAFSHLGLINTVINYARARGEFAPLGSDDQPSGVAEN
jgi:GH15 family glucan-1,4-alpha-glucosidase